ncbi:NgoFVII family restriction endonuclease [Lentimicrobium sp. L6]|uniref:phospholipase D family protein n=1 Tax=Lentimicrobium sp. L6 TaxID=2735916 RepID=UPI00155461FD|nr:phospholipase D family protein [Lentimicrobium sp. L6]NPD86030.1 NgoFVII family restriction endonuclease [Lentimicrobium sp. L6]
MIEVISKNWLAYFLEELENTDNVFLISPFVTNNIVNHLLSNKKKAKIQLITRFNLNDFRSRVSSLSALKKLVSKGAEIKGIQNLHSKVYIFDNKSTIIGSANFTSGGFFNNYEFGIKTIDQVTISNSKMYFQDLWQINSEILTINQIEDWEKELKNSQPTSNNNELPDYGKKALIQGDRKRKYFIKNFGSDDSRVNTSFTTKEEIDRSHCHWALTFSGKKGRPRKYRNGDIVYMARILHGTEYAIFGKAITLKHVDNRDTATHADIRAIPWKDEWPVYIRVKDPVLIDATMGDCPKMSELIDTLEYDSFDKPQKRFLEGKPIKSAWGSLRQQADVELTEIAAEWLENKFQETKNKYGEVTAQYLSGLYQGNPTIKEVIDNA